MTNHTKASFQPEDSIESLVCYGATIGINYKTQPYRESPA